MRIEEAAAIAYEAYTNHLHEGACEYEEHYTCPICKSTYWIGEDRWKTPHPCAETLPEFDRYVCSNPCRIDWISNHWEDIGEWMKIRERDFFKTMEISE